MGSTLKGREHSVVDLGLKPTRVLPEEDETSSGATEGLVGGGGNNISIVEGISSLLGGNQTTEVGHIHHQEGTIGISNSTETSIVPASSQHSTARGSELTVVGK